MRSVAVISSTLPSVPFILRVVRHRRAAIARIVADMPEEHRGGLVDALTSFADAAGDLLPSDPAARLGW